jgi:Kinesin motor domain
VHQAKRMFGCAVKPRVVRSREAQCNTVNATCRVHGNAVSVEQPRHTVPGPDNTRTAHRFQVGLVHLALPPLACMCEPVACVQPQLLQMHLFVQHHASGHLKACEAVQVDGVLDHATQEHVHSTIVAPLVAAALRGESGALLCCGAAASGKTHTAVGPRGLFAERGVIPRAITQARTPG